MCVGNGKHFCTPVLLNMCNIMFEVARLLSCLKSLQKKDIHDYIRCKELKGFWLE